ncbi:UNVERIFIED_CONTAM: hypothetical protein FKN15_023249 [Acipenser sinensis]
MFLHPCCNLAHGHTALFRVMLWIAAEQLLLEPCIPPPGSVASSRCRVDLSGCVGCPPRTSPANTTEPHVALATPGQTAGSDRPITPAPELTPPIPVVAPDVSIAEEDHDAISIAAS